MNADGFITTGQGLLGNNMFAYCANNAVSYKDEHGTRYCASTSVQDETAEERSQACQHQNELSRKKKSETIDDNTDNNNTHNSALENYWKQINDYYLLTIAVQTEITMQQNELIADAVSVAWDAYMHSCQLYQEMQFQEAQNLLYRFSTPELTQKTLNAVGAELTLISVFWGGKPVLATGAALALIAALIDENL